MAPSTILDFSCYRKYGSGNMWTCSHTESNVNNKVSMLADCSIINFEKHVVVMPVSGHAVRPVRAEAESLM